MGEKVHRLSIQLATRDIWRVMPHKIVDLVEMGKRPKGRDREEISTRQAEVIGFEEFAPHALILEIEGTGEQVKLNRYSGIYLRVPHSTENTLYDIRMRRPGTTEETRDPLEPFVDPKMKAMAGRLDQALGKSTTDEGQPEATVSTAAALDEEELGEEEPIRIFINLPDLVSSLYGGAPQEAVGTRDTTEAPATPPSENVAEQIASVLAILESEADEVFAQVSLIHKHPRDNLPFLNYLVTLLSLSDLLATMGTKSDVRLSDVHQVIDEYLSPRKDMFFRSDIKNLWRTLYQ